MPILNPNSTNYVHPFEPNLSDLHVAMDYREDGKPALRVITTFDGNIIIEGDVNIPGTVTVNSTPEDPVHNHITEVGTSGILNVPYLPIGGTVNIGTEVSVFTDSGNVLAITGEVTQGTSPWVISKDTNANSDSNRIYVNASGTVELGTTTLSALENITVTGTVELGTTTLSALENINATVSGTVALDATTLSALENTTVTVTGSVVVDNDSSNPLEVNAQITNVDPISVNVTGPVTVTQLAGSPTLVKYINNSNLQMDMADRLRVASTSQMWWYAPTIDKDGDLRYIESITGDNAASTFVQNLSSINLTSGTEATGSLIRISRRRHKLRPGISMLASFSINWNGYVPDGLVTKRVGMFTNFNGIFYEMTGDLAIVIRRRLTDGTLVERRVPRTSFTEDRLDGTGVTGYDLRPVVKQTANITAFVSKSSVVIGGNGGTVYRVVFTVSDPTQFFVSQKGRITGVTPTLFNGTVMVTAISGNNVTFVYNQDPGSFSSLSSAKFEHTNLHHQYVFGFDFTGTRVGKCRFFMDSPLGRTAIHVEDFSDELSTPFVNAPAMSLRYEIFNSGALGRLPNLTVSSEMINIEAEATLNPGFGTAQRSTTLGINKGVRTEYALLGVGLRTGEPNQRADLQVQNLQIIDAGNVNTQNAGVYQWRLVLNPTFAGTAVPTPTNVGKCTRTWNYDNGTTISGGVTLLSGYLTSTTELDVFTALNFLNLGSTIAYDDADKLVLAIKMVVDGTSDAALLATMNFIEAL
jgi:hypothetical protein